MFTQPISGLSQESVGDVTENAPNPQAACIIEKSVQTQVCESAKFLFHVHLNLSHF
jgi:hypothetical protein